MFVWRDGFPSSAQGFLGHSIRPSDSMLRLRMRKSWPVENTSKKHFRASASRSPEDSVGGDRSGGFVTLAIIQ